MKRAWIIVVAIAIVWVARHRHHPDPCALAQTWTAGDVHLYEDITLSPDHRGHWDLGSFDRNIEPDAQDFTWEASGTTLVFVADDGSRREVGYTTEPLRTRCVLSLDAYPLPRSSHRIWYTDGL